MAVNNRSGGSAALPARFVVRSENLCIGDWLHAEEASITGLAELSGELVILLDSGKALHLPVVGEVWWVVSRRDKGALVRSLVEVYRGLAGPQ